MVLEERGFRALKERMEGLERVGVLVDCLDVGLGGVGVREGGRVWVQLGVGGEGEGVDGGVDGDGDVEGEKTGGGGKVAVRGSWRAGGGQEGDRASMVLPFMLDLETEEGGGL